MFKLASKRPPLGSVKVTIGDSETTWHYRRVGAIELSQIDEDLRPFKAHAISRSVLYQANKEAVERVLKFISTDGDAEVQAVDLEVVSEINRPQGPTVLLPLYTWLANLIVQVDGVGDENGEALRWSELDDEQRAYLCSHIQCGQVHDLITKICRDSQLSEIELGK